MTFAPVLATRCAALVLPMLLAAAPVRAQIYAGSDPGSGAVVLSNFRSEAASTLVDGTQRRDEPAGAAVVAVERTPAAAAGGPAAAARTVARPAAAVRGQIVRAASRHQLSPLLLDAVILAESRYDPRAVSAKGAVGLMQLMPATGRRFGASDLFSTEQNIEAGAAYLKWLLAMFDGHLDLALAAYNAGEQAVVAAGCRIPSYPETRSYVKTILADLARRGAPLGRLAEPYAGGCA